MRRDGPAPAAALLCLALALALFPAGPAAAQDQVQPAPAPAQTAPAKPSPAAWLPRAGAELQALDKVNVKSETMSVPVGGTARFGSLTIQVRSCIVRPPDQAKDSAAFLTITDAHPDQPGFKGWMIASDPAASMLEHPLYDVRVLGCTGTG